MELEINREITGFINLKEGKGKRKVNDKGRTGMTKINDKGKKMTIVEYYGRGNIMVKFEGEDHLVKSTYALFEKAYIQSYIDSLKYGHGILGDEHMGDKDTKQFDSYKCWSSMLERCYCKQTKAEYPTYVEVTCCDSWLYYTNFKKWYDENIYYIEGQKMQLEKDILHKNNKIYSPDTCVFVPQRINNIFLKRGAERGKYPIGVGFEKRNPNKKYIATCHDSSGKSIRVGGYCTAEEAFYDGYKPFKENVIKEIADEYKDRIPVILYDAMYNYKVDIED